MGQQHPVSPGARATGARRGGHGRAGGGGGGVGGRRGRGGALGRLWAVASLGAEPGHHDGCRCATLPTAHPRRAVATPPPPPADARRRRRAPDRTPGRRPGRSPRWHARRRAGAPARPPWHERRGAQGPGYRASASPRGGGAMSNSIIADDRRVGVDSGMSYCFLPLLIDGEILLQYPETELSTDVPIVHDPPGCQHAGDERRILFPGCRGRFVLRRKNRAPFVACYGAHWATAEAPGSVPALGLSFAIATTAPRRRWWGRRAACARFITAHSVRPSRRAGGPSSPAMCATRMARPPHQPRAHARCTGPAYRVPHTRLVVCLCVCVCVCGRAPGACPWRGPPRRRGGGGGVGHSRGRADRRPGARRGLRRGVPLFLAGSAGPPPPLLSSSPARRPTRPMPDSFKVYFDKGVASPKRKSPSKGNSVDDIVKRTLRYMNEDTSERRAPLSHVGDGQENAFARYHYPPSQPSSPLRRKKARASATKKSRRKSLPRASPTKFRGQPRQQRPSSRR